MMRKQGILAAGVICSLLLTACGQMNGTVSEGGGVSMPDKIQIENADTQVITVNSRESVKVVPDIATIVYGVTTQGKDAAVSQTANSEKMNKLTGVLKGLGIEETSIQTSNYSLSPQRDWQNDGAITGYEMSVEVTVSHIPLERVGEILTASVDAGVNQVQSVTYLSSQYDASYQEALKQAVAGAEEKALALAEASGSTLGHAIRITEQSENQAARYQNMMSGAAKEGGAARMAVEMMPGEISVEANISVEYGITPS